MTPFQVMCGAAVRIVELVLYKYLRIQLWLVIPVLWTARCDDLDRIGMAVGLRRERWEPDARFRGRLKREMYGSWSNR